MAKKKKSKNSLVPRALTDIWSAGVGALSSARAAGSDGFDALVSRGRDLADSGGDAARSVLSDVESAASSVAGKAVGAVRGAGGSAAETVQDGLEAVVERVLGALGLPGRNEVVELQKQVEALQVQIGALRREAASAPKATAPRAATSAPAEARFSVQPHPDGWAVRRDGASRALSVHGTKREATLAGRQAAKAAAPSQLTLHRVDDTPGEVIEYGPPDAA